MRSASLILVALATACGRTTALQPRTPEPPPPGPPTCQLSITPTDLDFGDVTAGVTQTLAVTVQNRSAATCHLTGIALSPDTDSHFGLDGLDTGSSLSVAPYDTQLVRVRFEVDVASSPVKRTGTLQFATDDSTQPSISIPLVATLHFCTLSASPDPMNFGNVTLNTTADGTLSLTNKGNGDCLVTEVALGPDTSPLFSLGSVLTPFIVAPGDTQEIPVSFSASDSAPPHQRTGTVDFLCDDPDAGTQLIPISAYINSICTEIGQYIYTVDDQNFTFSRFDPKTLTLTDIAPLQCPAAPGTTPFSMNLDQKGTAWVLYSDGSIFKVDPTTAACTATTYVSGQHQFQTFGMGSVFDASTGVDTLYLAAKTITDGEQLGTLDLNSLVVTPIGPIDVGNVELAGTGDGELWAFAPSDVATRGVNTLAHLDPRTGATIDSYLLPEITSSGGWAIKFFGGNFYIFIGSDVWELPRTALLPGQTSPTQPAVEVASTPGRDIVGAGVSTCAPVQ